MVARIRHISGLGTLLRLDVLDLHGNMVSGCGQLCLCSLFIDQIRDITNLHHLTTLRVLNLAGNDISCVKQLSGLLSLTELNLRRNRITHMVSELTTQLSIT